MNFTGTLIEDLQRLVDSCLESHFICAICGQVDIQDPVADGCCRNWPLGGWRQASSRPKEAS